MAKKLMKKPAKKTAVKKAAPKKTAAPKKSVVKKALKPVASKQTKASPKNVAAKIPTAKSAAAKSANVSSLISPLDDRVLVQMESGERITAGGLIIPDTSEITGNQRGVVVAVGRGHRGKNGRVQPLDLQIGDRVLLGEMSGDEIEVSGHKLKILRESDVLGVVQK